MLERWRLPELALLAVSIDAGSSLCRRSGWQREWQQLPPAIACAMQPVAVNLRAVRLSHGTLHACTRCKSQMAQPIGPGPGSHCSWGICQQLLGRSDAHQQLQACHNVCACEQLPAPPLFTSGPAVLLAARWCVLRFVVCLAALSVPLTLLFKRLLWPRCAGKLKQCCSQLPRRAFSPCLLLRSPHPAARRCCSWWRGS